jgi:YegS/Rv2252/BmrU family lipid kinase
MFWQIILNPAAGNGAVERQWPLIERTLQDLGFSYSVQFTEGPGHASRLVDDALLNGHRYLLGVGGDGTNHEIANGLLRQNRVPATEVTYALLPVGTGNDWARQYQISRDPATRLRRLLEPQTVLQDVGKVQYQTLDGQTAERYFVNAAGMAYDGFVVKRMAEDGKANSHLEYLLAVARYLFQYTPEKARLEWAGQVVEDFFYTVNVGVCRFAGGGMQIVPHAVPNDGLLALTYARRMPRLEVLLQTRRFYNGSLLQHRKVGHDQIKSLHVAPAQPGAQIWLEADGEFLGVAPAEFSVLENALRVAL